MTEYGTVIRIGYPALGTTVFTEPGPDGDIENVNDNRVCTWRFDRYGSPAEVSDNFGHVSTFDRYEDETGGEDASKRHKLRQTAVTGKVVFNLLKNSGFDDVNEFDDAWDYETTQPATAVWGVDRKTDTGYYGNTSIETYQNNADGYTAVKQAVQLPAGTYTLSAYVYTEDLITERENSASGSSSGSGAPAGDIPAPSGAHLAVRTGNGTLIWSHENVDRTSDTDIDRGWRRIRQTFTLSTPQTVTVYGGIVNASGSARFDCFQLEEGEHADRFNMVNNSRFETGNMKGWSKQNTETGDMLYTDSEMGSCLKLTGNPDLQKRLIQSVYTTGPEGDVYRFGGFVKADAIPGKTFRIAAAVIYSDGTHKFENVDIDPYRTGWQYVSGIVSTDDENSSTDKTYTAIHLYIYYDNQMNPAYFTGMQMVKDDTVSYTYDRKGNLNTAKRTRENDSFQYDGNDLLRRFSSLDGTAYDTYYNDKRMPLYAKSAEGIGSGFRYNAKGQPVSMSLEADRSSRAVTAGRIYYIRQKRSGKYLDTRNGDITGSNIQQYVFNGSDDQKWKAENAGDGYIKLISQSGTKTRAVDVAGGVNAEGTNIQLYDDDGTDAQKFKLLPVEGGGYQLLSKTAEDKRCVMVSAGSGVNDVFMNGANVYLGTAAETEVRSIWYFEPADEEPEGGGQGGGIVSDAPEDGKIVRLRARHSGQYLVPSGETVSAGTVLQQSYPDLSEKEKYLLEHAENTGGTDWYYLKPVENTGLCVDTGTVQPDGYIHAALQAPDASSSSDSMKFRLIPSGTGYALISKTGCILGVKLADYANNAAVVSETAPASGVSNHQIFILEEVTKPVMSEVSYTEDGRNITGVTDARGKNTVFTYDSDNRLLSSVTDPNGHSIHYTYESSRSSQAPPTRYCDSAQFGTKVPHCTCRSNPGACKHAPMLLPSYRTDTDRVTGVSASVGNSTRSVFYTYDDADRLKTIGHNGTVYTYDYDGFGNVRSVKAGNTTLESHEYLPGNGLLKKVTYGNGASEEYVYDREEKLTGRKWNGIQTVTYSYDSDGNPEEERDLENGLTYRLRCDSTGRPVRVYMEENGAPVQSLELGYDSHNRVDSVTEILKDHKIKTSYLYGDPEQREMPGKPYGLKVDGVLRQKLTYDKLCRKTQEETVLSGNAVRYHTYSYGASETALRTDMLLKSMSNGTDTFTYTYDNTGNISSITVNGTQVICYVYDELNQLIRENNGILNKTVTYTYDLGGNMTLRKEYAYTTGTPGAPTKTDTFTYGNNSWRDLLTAYNGVSITYDGSGNPLSYRGMTMTWEKGRKLSSVVKNGVTTSFTYDSRGRRIRKTAGSGADAVTTKYYYNGSSLTGLTQGNRTVQFVYDAEGKPFQMRVYDTSGSGADTFTDYFYLYNGQGDVIGLIDSSNTVIVRYTYDSWGKEVSATDLSNAEIATLNPFRYRGYVYDPETELYYVISRYYDPEAGRFVSPDTTDILTATPGELTDKNIYAYCDNNPVMREDKNGCIWNILVGAAVGVISQYISDVIENIADGKTGASILTFRSSAVDYLASAASGALAATGINTIGAIAANASISGAAYLVKSEIEGKEATKGGLIEAVVIGGISGLIGGSGTSAKTVNGIQNTAKTVLKTAVSPKKIAMYTAKIAATKIAVKKAVTRTVASIILPPLAIKSYTIIF